MYGLKYGHLCDLLARRLIVGECDLQWGAGVFVWAWRSQEGGGGIGGGGGEGGVIWGCWEGWRIVHPLQGVCGLKMRGQSQWERPCGSGREGCDLGQCCGLMGGRIGGGDRYIF